MKETIAEFVKRKRKENVLTQVDLALYAQVSVKFVNELEGGKNTLRLNKVNDVLGVFDYQLSVDKKEKKISFADAQEH